jgi:hypothetical protein
MHLCPECGKQFEKLTSLSTHWRKAHKRTSEELAIIIWGFGKHPTCECGCGEPTRFISVSKGFTVWKRGHAMRVKNNWGHNSEAREHSLETRRKMWEGGEIIPWTKGKTKDDPEVAAMVEKMTKSITSNLIEIKRRSDHMKQQWADGTITPATGSAHPKWNGGTSQLSALCHGNPRLYTEWKYPKLLAAQFKCERCGSSDSLHVHHDDIRMAELIGEYRWILFPTVEGELPWDDKMLVVETVVTRHIEGNISGQILCHACHSEEHPSLNLSATSPVP